MSIYMSENEFRDFLRRFLEVRRETHSVTIGVNVTEAKQFLGGEGADTQRVLNDAIEFLGQVAEQVVADIKEGLKDGRPFPYPVDDFR